MAADEGFDITEYIYGCGCNACKSGNAACINSYKYSYRCECGGVCSHYGVPYDFKRHVHVNKKLIRWLLKNTLELPKKDIAKFRVWHNIYKAVFTESMRNPASVPIHINAIVHRLFSQIKKEDIIKRYKSGTTDWIKVEVDRLLNTDAKWFGFSVDGAAVREFIEILKPIISPYITFSYFVHLLSTEKPDYWAIFENEEMLPWLKKCVEEGRKVMDFSPAELMITPGEMFKMGEMLRGFMKED